MESKFWNRRKTVALQKTKESLNEIYENVEFSDVESNAFKKIVSTLSQKKEESNETILKSVEKIIEELRNTYDKD